MKNRGSCIGWGCLAGCMGSLVLPCIIGGLLWLLWHPEAIRDWLQRAGLL